ncbi:histone acetyltransferase HPA2 [Thiopseudomonas acetoxidans]|uniref:Histone acetyltransferase HPA2 n=1 Tax=Thiopseudomonas acetoxidans TaxID=3041622 RepID=A0ABT7SMB1_9GAMM|nr:histone acetyltransferase HPA2 [Thiopseudomonas sp. CY1220]MDM7857317.1 histone acetyltransferase HPA2 [Thiopseudomonas sp. CY1220]
MPKTIPPQAQTPEDLGDIEFNSPGVFSVHNPTAPTYSAPVTDGDEAVATIGQAKRVLLTSMDAVRTHSIHLISQAKRELCIYSLEFEPWLYDNDETYQYCKEFLLAHERNRLRILLRDTSRIVQEGHRLLPLAERLHSRCQIRRVNSEHPFSDNYWLDVDQQALLLRQAETPKQASAYYYDPALAQKKHAEFEAMWSVARLDVNLRRMPL